MNPQSLHIDEPEAYELAAAIAERTGRSLTAVVVEALRREKDRVVPVQRPIDMDKVNEILERIRTRPAVSDLSTEQILDDLYDKDGLPK